MAAVFTSLAGYPFSIRPSISQYQLNVDSTACYFDDCYQSLHGVWGLANGGIFGLGLGSSFGNLLFGGRFFDQSGAPTAAVNYEEDWSGVWAR